MFSVPLPTPKAAQIQSAGERGRGVTAPAVAAVAEDEIETVSDSPGDVADAANVWPDEHAEAAFISEARGRGETVVASPEIVEEVSLKPLPSLDEMVKRIPAPTRDLLDELFRAKFTTVRRVKKSDLKN